MSDRQTLHDIMTRNIGQADIARHYDTQCQAGRQTLHDITTRNVRQADIARHYDT